jgi:LPS-assembly protein
MAYPTRFQLARSAALLAVLAFVFLIAAHSTSAQQAPGSALRLPTGGGEATLEADQQRQVGKIFYADGHVEVQYQNARLRADHAEYDSEKQVVVAHGNLQLDYLTQHIEADDGRYELVTHHGTFHHVRGTFVVQRRPSSTLLISPNPLYFDAEEADRVDENTYVIQHAWLTVCDPNKPTWKFYAPRATIQLQKSVHLENGNFRLFTIPVLYLPYASFPAEKRRDSGFLVPELGHTSQKGTVVGDAFYWAPLDWLDMTLGGADYNKRGWSQKGQLRLRPWENTNIEANYYGVIDRGLPQQTGPPLNQGGHELKLLFTSQPFDGWRAVADLDQLTSLTFRLAWFETFTEAVNSEVRNTAFVTNNFGGFSLNIAASSYQNYLSATPQTSITLRTAPEFRFSTVYQQFLRHLPFYFSFEGFTGAVQRSENITPFETPGFVNRSEIAPSITWPMHLGDWLHVTPTFTFRSTYWGGQLGAGGEFIGRGLSRNTEEFSLDFRLANIERTWGSGDTKWKHVIEPEVVYRYVDGVDDYNRIVLFDQDETLTDTNEIEYGITQRLFRKKGSGSSEELVTWRLVQKFFFDPSFGGALVPGQPNIFQALDSLTPFVFADTPRHYSPIVSDVTIAPGKRWDAESIINYDPQSNRLTAIGTLLKLKPYKASFITLAHYSVLNLPLEPAIPPPNFEQHSNQVRTLLGYGDPNRRGWNVTAGTSYDFTLGTFQGQLAEVNYNGGCCGIGFEYRRFSFGTIRNENQYSVVFRIANLGSVGNMRRQEKVF